MGQITYYLINNKRSPIPYTHNNATAENIGQAHDFASKLHTKIKTKTEPEAQTINLCH